MAPAEVSEANDDPWAVIRRADQRHDDAGWTNTGLDKAWSRLQQLFLRDGREPSPAYDLVAGDVSYPGDIEQGHLPYVGVLAPAQVPPIARDLTDTTRFDVRSLVPRLPWVSVDRRREEEQYIWHFVREATTFASDAAARGHGIVYVIR